MVCSSNWSISGKSLFKLHPIGITDDFFELGGHSLMMIMLMARVEERLGKRVAMAELFTDPTIEHLAELIGHGKENLVSVVRCADAAGGNESGILRSSRQWRQSLVLQRSGETYRRRATVLWHTGTRPETGLVVHTEIEAMASDYVEAIRGCSRLVHICSAAGPWAA